MNAAAATTLLAREREYRVISLGARQVAFVERVMRFWDAALRASLVAGRSVHQSCTAADAVTRLYAARLTGTARVTALPLPDGWRDRGGQAGGDDWWRGEQLNALRLYRSTWDAQRAASTAVAA